jgi:hypothetical protein
MSPKDLYFPPWGSFKEEMHPCGITTGVFRGIVFLPERKIIPLGITLDVSLWNNGENYVDAPFPPLKKKPQ